MTSERPSGAQRQTRVERRKAMTRAKILAAARHLFASRGFEQTTIRDIAEDADIALGGFYNYFPTKEDVLAALLQDALTEQLQLLTRRRQRVQDVAERVSIAHLHLLAAVREDPDWAGCSSASRLITRSSTPPSASRPPVTCTRASRPDASTFTARSSRCGPAPARSWRRPRRAVRRLHLRGRLRPRRRRPARLRRRTTRGRRDRAARAAPIPEGTRMSAHQRAPMTRIDELLIARAPGW